MSNVQKVDISTRKERENTFQLLNRSGWVMLPLVNGLLPSEINWLMWKAGKYLFDSFKSLFSVEKEIEEQREAAVRIIQAGKENGVDELEITMSEKAGLSLESSVEGFPVELIAGKSGNMTLKVKYK